MAYINNGISRSLKVAITKKIGGVTVLGYPKTYDGQGAFPGYLALTDTQFAQLSDADFTTRYNDFVNYVEFVEAGVDFATDIVGDGATKTDPTCLETTTSTTTECVYTFNDPVVTEEEIELLYATAELYFNTFPYIIITITPNRSDKTDEEGYTLWYVISRVRGGSVSIIETNTFFEDCFNNVQKVAAPQIPALACGDEYYIDIYTAEPV